MDALGVSSATRWIRKANLFRTLRGSRFPIQGGIARDWALNNPAGLLEFEINLLLNFLQMPWLGVACELVLIPRLSQNKVPERRCFKPATL
jgi:hypothetical protein